MLKAVLTVDASYDCKKDNIIYINFLNNFVVMGLYALKRANRILFLDMVGSFFEIKRVIPQYRSPPTINLDFKKI